MHSSMIVLLGKVLAGPTLELHFPSGICACTMSQALLSYNIEDPRYSLHFPCHLQQHCLRENSSLPLLAVTVPASITTSS